MAACRGAVFYNFINCGAAFQRGTFMAWLGTCFLTGGDAQALIFFGTVLILRWRYVAIVTVFLVFIYGKFNLQGNYFSFQPVDCLQ